MKTDWYRGNQKPARAGFYERDYSDAKGYWFGSKERIFLCYWRPDSYNGGNWFVDDSRSIHMAYFQHLPWRGLTKKSINEN